MKKNSKRYSTEIIAIICIFILFTVYGIYTYIQHKDNAENAKLIEQYMSITSKKQNEIDNVKEKIEKNQSNKDSTYDKPYLPDGFKHIEGSWNDGYVIQDEQENEFVWVPCKAYINNDVVELKRYNFDVSNNLLINQCYESDENIKEFIESIGKYEGFYIARYEAGKENGNVVSKKNTEVYTNVNYEESLEFSRKMYQKDGFTSSLVNSLAWDTTLKWIDKTSNSKYSTKGSYTSSYSNVLQNTGYDSINKIYDLSGNAGEWTTEKSHENFIFRGGYSNNTKESRRAPGYRNTILGDSKSSSLGFRVILYSK